MTLENVAGEHGLHVVHRAIDIGKLDGGAERRDRLADLIAVVRRRAGRGRCTPRSRPRRPASASRRATPSHRTASSARSSRKPTIGAVSLQLVHRCRRAEADLPADLPARRRRAVSRRSSICARMPSAMRGSSSVALMNGPRPDLVARRLDRARAHPAPHQHHVLARGVVEAVPDAARRIDHVAFARRLEALVGDDVAVALQHDEELVAVAMQMPLVAGAGLEHGPADDVVGAGRFLVDQELHLHVDPAVVALEAFDLRHVLDVGAEHLGAERCRRDAGRRLHRLGQRGADLLGLCSS